MSTEFTGKDNPSNTKFFFCSECGTRLKENANFCTECGYVVGQIQQPPAALTVQSYYPRKKYGTRVAGAVLLSIGFTLLITAGLLFLLSWGYFYMLSTIFASVGGGLMVLGGIIMLIPVKKS